MTSRPLVLLPPSLTKSRAARSSVRAGKFDVTLAAPRARVLAALEEVTRDASTAQLATLFSARGELLARAQASLASIVAGKAPRVPAWRRYQGVVWVHLDPATLKSAERRRLVVPSGLYGFSTGEDPIADYRLKMNAHVAGLGVLANFWRSQLTAALREMSGRAPIVNLLPNEHAAAVDFASLEDRDVVSVRFVAPGGARAIGHDAKAVKGLVARAVVRDGLTGLSSLSLPDWRIRRDDRGFVVTRSGPAT